MAKIWIKVCCTLHIYSMKPEEDFYTCGEVFPRAYYVVVAASFLAVYTFSWSHFYLLHANKCHENYICMQLMRGLHVTSSYISSFFFQAHSHLRKCFTTRPLWSNFVFSPALHQPSCQNHHHPFFFQHQHFLLSSATKRVF